MKPEDLGIKSFKPAPDPKAELQRKADIASLRIDDLTRAAERIANDSIALKGALDRSQASGQRLSVENFHLKRIIAELRLHRALLFWICVGIILLVLLRR